MPTIGLDDDEQPRVDPSLSAAATAAVLALLSILFLGRVVGQVLVVTRHPTWLPPMEQWYSGLLAYPRLLATQVAILAGMTVLIVGLVGEARWAVGPYPALGTVLVVVAYGYAAAMGARYVVRMARRPDQRWLGGCIPIVFHVVLATWIWVIAGLWRAT
jgi:hypothetical protein